MCFSSLSRFLCKWRSLCLSMNRRRAPGEAPMGRGRLCPWGVALRLPCSTELSLASAVAEASSFGGRRVAILPRHRLRRDRPLKAMPRQALVIREVPAADNST